MLISEFGLRHKTTVLTLIVCITVLGSVAYVTLPRESAPDVQIPYVMVMTFYEGATPSDMESLITYPLERKLKSINDVREMTSTSSEGLSIITLEFEPDVNIDTALQKVRDKRDEAKPDLPTDLYDDPIVKELSFDEMFPVLMINISGDIGMARLKKIAEDMEEDIEQIRGVLEAEILGALEREIRVEFDDERVSAYGLTMGEIVQTVTQNNVNTPGGSIDIGEAKYHLKAPAQFVSPDEIQYLVAAVRDGRPIYLSDVATVRDTFKDRESFSRINGVEAVSIKVTKRAGEHILRIADEVKDVVDQYRERLSSGITFTITSDASKDIHMMVSDLENNILTGLILVLVVIFVALGMRNAVLVASAIPLSMLIAFFLIQALGITLNMVVLFSLILALGMLVDNAIVIIENIYRHHVEEGKPLEEAARAGVAEVGWPVIASTATTVAAFFPMLFWPGIMGQFMGYLPKTVIIVLTASLFVALFITPTLAALFIKKPKNWKPAQQSEGQEFGPIIRGYRRLLTFGLRYRVLSVCFFFGCLYIVASAFGQSGLGVELFPDTEPSSLTVYIEAPEGTNVYRTNQFARQAEAIIAKYGNIEHVTTTVGAGSGGNESGPNTASMLIDMVDRELRMGSGDDGKIYFRNSNDTLNALRTELVPAIVGAQVTVDKREEGPPTGSPVNVEISGEDYHTLARLAGRLERDIRNLPGLVDLKSDFRAGLPEINIQVDKERAALLGLNTFLIGQLIKAAVNGIKIGDYREGEDEYDITARMPLSARQNMQDILRLLIPAPDGSQVPLTSVASIVTGSGLSSIRHIDAKRVVSVSANVAAGFNSEQVLQRVQTVAKIGPSLLKREDVNDPAALAVALDQGASPLAAAARDRLTPETRALLERSASLSEDDVEALIYDLNRRVLDDSTFAAVARDRAVELIAQNGLTESPTLEYRARLNRLLLNDVAAGALAAPSGGLDLPLSYFIRYTGENEEREESGAFILKAFVIACLLIAMVLVTQFDSILTPLIIMASVILSFIGVFLGLLMTHTPFGIIMTGMGVISLAGVVVNNAIVLIDYINLLRKQGMACYEAIIQAGCTRFRPVMLTAVTTVLSLTPMAVGVSFDFKNFAWQIDSDSSQWWGPMAVAVIFGLVISTALTLFVVPNLYSLFFDWGFHKRSHRLIVADDGEVILATSGTSEDGLDDDEEAGDDGLVAREGMATVGWCEESQ